MAQVAFDTLQASEELQTAGLSREQARAISLVVRKSHEVADVATKADIAEVKRDIADVRKDLSAEISEVRRDMDARFVKVDAQFAEVRKDLHNEVTNVRKDLQLEMAGIRSEQKLMRWMLGAIIAGIVSLIIKAFFVAAV